VAFEELKYSQYDIVGCQVLQKVAGNGSLRRNIAVAMSNIRGVLHLDIASVEGNYSSVSMPEPFESSQKLLIFGSLPQHNHIVSRNR
jgi:hypothetical protein